MDEAILMGKASEGTLGVRDLIAATGWKPSRVLDMVGKLEQEGLVECEQEAPHGRGRPRKLIRLTELGRKFLAAFRECDRLRLRTGLADVSRAVRQARDVARLVQSGHSPYQMLWELDEIVRAVRDSAKAA